MWGLGRETGTEWGVGWEGQVAQKRDSLGCERTWAEEGVQGQDWGCEGGHTVGIGEGMRREHWDEEETLGQGWIHSTGLGEEKRDTLS